MSTGELLDRTFALYRKNFVLFVGIAAVTHAAYLAFELLMIRTAPVSMRGPRFATAYYANLALAWAFLIVAMTISQAATVKAVAAVHLEQTTSISASYRSLWGRLASLFGVLALVFLIAGVLTAVLVAIAILFVGLLTISSGSQIARSGPASMALGFAIIFGIFSIFVAVYVRYALAVQACVVENLTAWASLKRSASLSKGARLRIATVYVVLLILSWIFSASLTWLARWAAIPWHSRILSSSLIDLAQFIAGSLAGPLATIGISLIYYDERVRKEAFDLHLMLASLDAPPPVQVAGLEVGTAD